MQSEIEKETARNENNFFVSDDLKDILQTYEEEKIVAEKKSNEKIFVYLFLGDKVFKTDFIKYSSKNNRYVLHTTDDLFFNLKSDTLKKIYIENKSNYFEEDLDLNKSYTYKITLRQENSYIIDIKIKEEV